MPHWIAIWITWVAMDIVFATVFFLAICVQWRDLRFAIRSVTGRGSASWDTQSSAHLSNLKWSYRILIATGLIILSILIMFICIETPMIYRLTILKVLNGERIAEVRPHFSPLGFLVVLLTLVFGDYPSKHTDPINLNCLRREQSFDEHLQRRKP